MTNDLSSYFDEPEFKEILAKYEGMMKNHAHVYFDADELLDLIEYYDMIGKYKNEDNPIIDYALHLHPHNTDILIYQIRNLYYRGYKQEAYKILSSIDDEENREVKFLRAELLTEENQPEEADEVYQELATSENESLEVLKDIAICYLDKNDPIAYKWIKKISDKGYNETNSQLYRDLWCDCCMTFDKPENAIQAFQISLDENPYSIRHWNGLAKCYLDMDELASAQETIEFSLAIDNDNREANELKALCNIQTNNYEDAIHLYKKLLATAQSPSNNIYKGLSQCYLEADYKEEALACMKEWMEVCPQLTNEEKAEICVNIAACYCNLELPEEGMVYINQSLELDPLSPLAMVQKGTLYLQLNKGEEADELFKRAIEISEEKIKGEIHFNVAYNCHFAKDYKRALTYVCEVLDLYPRLDENSFVLLACCYYELGNMSNCMRFLKHSLYNFRDRMNENSYIVQLLHSLILKLKKKYIGPLESF